MTASLKTSLCGEALSKLTTMFAFMFTVLDKLCIGHMY